MYSISSKVRFLLTSTIFLLLSITTLLAQEPASGSIEFEASNSSGSVDVELVGAQAQSLQTSSIYNIDGMTNEAIPFNWEVLGVEEFAEVYGSYINPSGAFDGVFSNPLDSTFEAGVYSLLGQKISTPEVTYSDNHVSIYDTLENVAEGMYVVTLIGSNGESESIRFIKIGNATNNPISISDDEVLNKESINENPFGQQRMVDNYNIIWDDGYGVEAGSQSVTINAGSGNVINVTTSTLENPYYTVNGSITGGTNGTATYDSDDGEQFTAPINGTTFTLTDIVSQFDNVNAVEDILGDLTLTGTWGTFETSLDLTTDGEGEIIVNVGPYDVGGSSGVGNIGVSAYLGGLGEQGFICNITNSETNQTFQEIATNDNFVYYVDLPIETLPSDTYNGIIEDTDPDPKFLPTSFSVDIEEGTNPTHIVDVIPIPNEQDITVPVKDLFNLSQAVVNYQVQAKRADNNSVIATVTTDSNGEAFFENIPGETDIYFVGSANDYYTKTDGVYSVPLVDRISKQDTILNTTAIPIYQVSNGAPISGLQLKQYLQGVYHTEFINGHWRVHFINGSGSQRQDAIDAATDLAGFMGMPGSLMVVNNPFSEPNGTIQNNYDPYQDANTFPGQVGNNVTAYSGTDTNIAVYSLPNGNLVTYYNTEGDLGNELAEKQHELAIMLGANTISVGAGIIPQTCLDDTNPSEFSPWDENLATITMLGRVHYVFTDGQGRRMQYELTTDIED